MALESLLLLSQSDKKQHREEGVCLTNPGCREAIAARACQMLTAGEVSAPVLPASPSSLSSLLQFRAQPMKHLPHSGSFYLKSQPGCDSGYPDLDNSALRRLFPAVSLGCAKVSVKAKQVGLLGTDTQEHPLTTGIEGCVAQHPYLLAGPSFPHPHLSHSAH